MNEDAKLIACMTALTYTEATVWLAWTSANGIEDAKAVPFLIAIVNCLPDVHVGPAFFSHMAALFNLKEPSTT